MHSPFTVTSNPHSFERRRRGRGVDVMSTMPTPPRSHQPGLPTPVADRRRGIPTPVTERRKGDYYNEELDAKTTAVGASQSRRGHLPTPQTLPRKRDITRLHRGSSPMSVASDDDADDTATSPLPSPSGHTTFFLSSASAHGMDKVPPRRRPGLMFAQQMGLAVASGSGMATGPAALPSLSAGFGARLGVGVGMGGGMRAVHGQVDKIAITTTVDNPFLVAPAPCSTTRKSTPLDNPFLVAAPATSTTTQNTRELENPFLVDPLAPRSTSSAAHTSRPNFAPSTAGKPHLIPIAQSPGTDTRHVPAALRSSADRSLSPASYSTHVHAPPSLGSRSTRPPRASGVAEASTAALCRERERQSRELRRKERERQERIRMMDVDDNPFLAKPGEVILPQPTTEEDRPLVTYVFRGVKKQFANPFIPSSASFPRSKLDVADPEYEPHPCPAPKLLWPTAPAQSLTDEVTMDDNDDENYSDTSADMPTSVRRGLLFGPKRGVEYDNGLEQKRKRSRL